MSLYGAFRLSCDGICGVFVSLLTGKKFELSFASLTFLGSELQIKFLDGAYVSE